jgi:hypothetical protein
MVLYNFTSFSVNLNADDNKDANMDIKLKNFDIENLRFSGEYWISKIPKYTKIVGNNLILKQEYSGIYYRIDSASKYYEKEYLKVDYKCVIDNSNILLYTIEEAENIFAKSLVQKRQFFDVQALKYIFYI